VASGSLTIEGAAVGKRGRAATNARIISRKDAKARRKNVLSFRPPGEIFFRSLAFAWDDRLSPVT
jgi:hypothetical protein